MSQSKTQLTLSNSSLIFLKKLHYFNVFKIIHKSPINLLNSIHDFNRVIHGTNENRNYEASMPTR